MSVADVLRELEEDLFKPSTRKNADRVSLLLADEFREFGSSGRVYTKAAIIASLLCEPLVEISLKDFHSEMLTDGIVLVTYRALKRTQGKPVTETLRSSIWILRLGRWMMLFHQGTKTA